MAIPSQRYRPSRNQQPDASYGTPYPGPSYNPSPNQGGPSSNGTVSIPVRRANAMHIAAGFAGATVNQAFFGGLQTLPAAYRVMKAASKGKEISSKDVFTLASGIVSTATGTAPIMGAVMNGAIAATKIAAQRGNGISVSGLTDHSQEGKSYTEQAKEYNAELAANGVGAGSRAKAGFNELSNLVTGKSAEDGGKSEVAVSARDLKKMDKQRASEAKHQARADSRDAFKKSFKAAISGDAGDMLAAKAARDKAGESREQAQKVESNRKANQYAQNHRGLRGVVQRPLDAWGGRIRNSVDNGVMNTVQAADAAAKKAREIAMKAANEAKKVANFIKSLPKKIINFVKAVGMVVTNPAFWITVAILTTVLLGFSGYQTYFPSNTDCNKVTEVGQSSSSGSGDNTTSGGVIWNDNAKKVAELIQKKGFSKAAAAGIMGSFMQESGFNPGAVNSSSGATGLAQWLGQRLTNLENFASSKGKSHTDLEVQMDFLWQEVFDSTGNGGFLGNSSLRDQWAKAMDAKSAARAWYDGFERGGESQIGSRISYAEQYYKLLDEIKGDWVENGKSPDFPPGGSSANSSSSSSSSSSDSANCTSGADGAGTGAIGGAKECDKGGCDYSWMCDEMKVCHDGEYGTAASGAYRYQCVWYAWTRAAMVYKDTFRKDWDIVLGNGGDIWANAQGKPGWEVDTTPHPGDIISGHAQPFAGSTHVAFVEKVESDPSGWKIYISEGNYSSTGDGPWNGYHTRWLTKNQALVGDNHFLRHKSWKSVQDAASGSGGGSSSSDASPAKDDSKDSK